MSAGCTSCHRKGGCDHRKSDMFAAIEEALVRLYPDRRWHERADGPAGGVGTALGLRLAELLARRLSARTLFLPGGEPGCCSYVYVLCTGRPPALIDRREGLGPAGVIDDVSPGRGALEELYLRVALSGLAPFAAVQQVTLRGEPLGDRLLVEETPRSGVFDPPLLRRFQQLVAVLAELRIRHLDCGEIVERTGRFRSRRLPRAFRGPARHHQLPVLPTTGRHRDQHGGPAERPPGAGARHFPIDGEPVSSNLDLIGG